MAFPGITHEWQQIVVFVSIASMALGAFAAIGQRNIKRLMAYSSIGHMGFALVGLAAGTPEGVQGVLVYMAIYVAMTLGTFACILSMRRDGVLVENIGDLAGLSRTHPTMAFFLAMLLFSLAGIPPLAGFFAKFYVFLAAIKAGLYALAVIGVLSQRGGRLLLSDDRQDDVFRRAGEELPEHAGAVAAGARRVRAAQSVVLRLSRAARGRGDGRRRSRCSECNREATDLAGVRHIAYETLGSTNAEALARARAGERGPLWITAQSQSAGRGRRGSTWVSPPGNLYATLLLTEPSAPERRRNCRSWRRWRCMTRSPNARRSSGRMLTLKWPNDLLLGRRQARRHPDRRRERAGLRRRHRHRRQLRRPSHGHRLSGDRSGRRRRAW